MAKTGIDVVRGVSIRFHEATGIKVYMYFDKPGEYFNAHGVPVSEKLALEAGFDIAKLRKQREKAKLMDAYREKVEEQLAIGSDDEERVLAERNGFRVIGLDYGLARLIDEDGDSVNPTPIPEEQAFALLNELFPEDTQPEPETKGSKGSKGKDPDED